MKKYFLIALIFFFITSNAFCFESNYILNDTIKRHSPKKAGYFSLILPGLGQAYNQQYIKIPVIYALGTVTMSLALKEHAEYKLFKTVNNLANKNLDYSSYVPKLQKLGKDNATLFESNRDNARNSRDLFFVYTGLIYILNITDAIVSAHLKEFNISDDLSLKAEPLIFYQNQKAIKGLALTLNF